MVGHRQLLNNVVTSVRHDEFLAMFSSSLFYSVNNTLAYFNIQRGMLHSVVQRRKRSRNIVDQLMLKGGTSSIFTLGTGEVL